MICNTCRRAAMRSARLPLRTLIRAPPAITRITTQTPTSTPRRLLSTSTSRFSAAVEEEPDLPSMSPAESAIAEILSEKLQPTELLVQDVSGGCGSMYAIDITSPAFKGQTILKQQRMVNAALGDLVKGWHGVQIRTKVPSA
ncbi:altered inheritance of mitochondria 1 [Fusarium subglutinans]|uniref:Altered inheritance of mitochondria 1 n=1 Tax=Gibberella subglutinans TaxID=42677 RepID=A0A8H5V972_GIBSU|nr:altered inheritance of mitochondria 1 [Fusarium subglutinans]KAF5613833.1 altered inheritance of mitochondria 1 [Fusarium subglutinans]